MTDLLFVLFRFGCFVYVELASALLVWFNPIQTSQIGGQPYCDNFPYSECFLV